MVLLYDAEDSSDSAKAFDYGYACHPRVVRFPNDFLRRYHLFAHLFDGGFVPDLYNSLSVYVLYSYSAQTKYSYSAAVKGR
jgi:ataxin-10